MPAKATITASLTTELNTFIAEKVASGQYRTAGEVIRAALRCLGQQNDRDVHVEAAYSVTTSEQARPAAATPAFLQGGDMMGALMRQHPWAATPLGDAEAWPHSLKTLMGVMLGLTRSVFWSGPSARLLHGRCHG
ncbi:ribbon-helix-helix domain-containing protein [Methylobacterium sp. WSM2598]|uniref:ribbon-helix-helix domain-containing protein n=1 Tax=Methylobacterium sp. WSM2598 TaxID=398261 RepID=UPI000370E1FE|nr:type II toxin-antitoxin system ParD family antitoxin [Methylobacterium sp. WSM2598]